MEELAPGFRFFPTEEELVSFYLHNKLAQQRPELHRVIPELNIYDLEPWQLPQHAGEICRGDTEQWFFFVPRQQREAQGGRPTRTTACGYWKATGSPGCVYSSSNRAIGVKKTMVFYTGKAPTGRKTTWKMNEYRAIVEEDAGGGACSSSIPKLRLEYSVCRVYVISGNFRAFDRRPMGTMTSRIMEGEGQVIENEPNMMSRNINLIGETSLPEPSGAGEDGGADPEPETVDELDMDCLAQFSWEQMDWL
ncbi:unnamed protein product [Rhodiola kirilowii]